MLGHYFIIHFYSGNRQKVAVLNVTNIMCNNFEVKFCFINTNGLRIEFVGFNLHTMTENSFKEKFVSIGIAQNLESKIKVQVIKKYIEFLSFY